MCKVDVRRTEGLDGGGADRQQGGLDADEQQQQQQEREPSSGQRCDHPGGTIGSLALVHWAVLCLFIHGHRDDLHRLEKKN